MEEKRNRSKNPQKWADRHLNFKFRALIIQKPLLERKSASLIQYFKENQRIKWNSSPTLEMYLAEEILNDIRNLKNITSIKYSYFNNLNLSNQWQILRHFEKIISEEDKQRFYQIMLLSRESEVYLASSNAATILNKTGFSFNDKNLQKIKIPYADLSNNSFIRTVFSYSDLRHVDFSSSFVAFSDFSNCEMSKSELEKIIFESKDREIVEKITLSKCGQYIASLNSMKILTKRSFVSVFSVDNLIEINTLQLSNYRIEISYLKFSSDSSCVYILYWKEELLIWNFIENKKEIIKLQDKIHSLQSAFSETMLAYSVPGFIRVISLFTFLTLFQVQTGKKLGYQVINITDKYLFGKKGNKRKYRIWLTEFGVKYKKISADVVIFCDEFYIKIYENALQIIKTQFDEPVWKISDTNYRYISSDKNFLASFKGNEISIIEIQKQALFKYSYFNECWNNSGWLNLFKFSFFGIKNKAKVLKPSKFSDEIEFKKYNINKFSMLFTKSVITIFWLGFMKEINVESMKVIKTQDIPNCSELTNMAVSDDVWIFIINPFIEIWNSRTQKLIKAISLFGRCSDVQISLEKNQFSLKSTSKYSFYIYSIESGEIIHTIEYGPHYSTCYKFTGNHLIFFARNTIGVWDKNSGNCTYTHTGFSIINIEGSPCRRWAAFQKNNQKNEAVIFNIETKLYKMIVHERADLIQDFSHFSPCGNYLVTASILDIIIWESATGLKIAKTRGLFPEIQRFSYSQCGKYIASYAKGDLILIWNVEETLSRFEKRNSIDLDINLCLEKASISNATIFSDNNLSGVSYISDDSI